MIIFIFFFFKKKRDFFSEILFFSDMNEDDGKVWLKSDFIPHAGNISNVKFGNIARYVYEFSDSDFRNFRLGNKIFWV